MSDVLTAAYFKQRAYAEKQGWPLTDMPEDPGPEDIYQWAVWRMEAQHRAMTDLTTRMIELMCAMNEKIIVHERGGEIQQ